MSSNKKTVQLKADAKRAGKRARAWTCVVYPDSENTPENWKEVLSEQLVECLISPLHDKDKNPDGEDKKPHYHVVLSFKNPTSFDKAQEVFQAIGGVVPPENESRVKDFRQMARYLCHLDQPDKYRYDTEDVVSIGAIDYLALIMSSADEDEMLSDICDFIDTNQITSFVAFSRFVRIHRKQWWTYCHSKKGYFIREYIKSLAWDIKNPAIACLSFPDGMAILPDSGEVIPLLDGEEAAD